MSVGRILDTFVILGYRRQTILTINSEVGRPLLTLALVRLPDLSGLLLDRNAVAISCANPSALSGFVSISLVRAAKRSATLARPRI